MYKAFGILLALANISFAGMGEQALMTCSGRGYNLTIAKSTGVQDAPGLVTGTLLQDGKLVMAVPASHFDGGPTRNYGYFSGDDNEGFSLSINHVQPAEMPWPYALGTLEVIRDGKPEDFNVRCNTSPGSHGPR